MFGCHVMCVEHTQVAKLFLPSRRKKRVVVNRGGRFSGFLLCVVLSIKYTFLLPVSFGSDN